MKLLIQFYFLYFLGYQQMKEDEFPKRYGIYGIDGSHETNETEELEMPTRMEPHSPVLSHIRKGSQYPYFGYHH